MSKSTCSKNTKGILLEISNTNNVVITHVLLNWSLIGSNFFHKNESNLFKFEKKKSNSRSRTNTRYMLNIWYKHKLH